MVIVRSLAASALCLAALSTRAAADVVVVAANSPYASDYPSIQTAINAAADGDTIVVRSGTYGTFAVDGRELAIVAAPGASVIVNGSVRIEHTALDAVVLLAGLQVAGDAQEGYGVLVRSNPGFVRVQECTFKGRTGIVQTLAYADGFGAEGALVESSPTVAFARCSFTGGQPPYSGNCCDVGYLGGQGIWSKLSGLALYDCTLTGGTGSAGGWGGFGGDALHLVSGNVFASGTSFTGGTGGFGDDFIYGPGGNGGNGTAVSAGAVLQKLDTTAQGGFGGSSFLPGQGGGPGQASVGAGAVLVIPGTARKLSGPTAVAENASVVLTVQGQPGDRVYLSKSLDAGFAFVSGWHGVKLVAGWPRLGLVPLAVVPGSGTTTFTLHADDLVTSTTSRVRHTQLFVKSPSSGPYLGAPLDLVVFECGIAGDCNQNGTPDLCDIQNGLSADCNSNGVPDECDIEAGVLPDCNQNGVADACDISSGSSTDCNGDGVPDECDYDCNGNGTPDACDISNGASADCNGDGLPDECNLDCNGNGIADDCDISAGTSLDLNGNGVPDECQSASDVYYVAADALPNGDGTLARPFDSIATGVAYAIDGNNVVLLDGTYTGAANREVDFGGRQIVVRGLHGAATSIIDCQGLGRAFLFTHGEPAGSGLAGLTIRNGSATSSTLFPAYGGAIFTKDSDPSIVNCRFENCFASNSGGAIRVGDGTGNLTVKNTVFLQNHASNGGAISFGSTAGTSANMLSIKNATFTLNQGTNGGALQCKGQSITVSDSWFDHTTGNATLTGNGGAIRLQRTRFTDGTGAALSLSTPNVIELVACRFQGNHAGGGQLTGVVSSTTVRVDQCLFDANTGGVPGALWIVQCQDVAITQTTTAHGTGTVAGAFYFVSIPSVTIANSILWNDTAPGASEIRLFNSALAVANSDVYLGAAGISMNGPSTLTWGAGNLSVDPLFQSEIGADANALTWADNVLQLGAGSPCIDAGDNSFLQVDLADLDNDGNFAEPVPRDLQLSPRRVDDPLAPDVGAGAAPLTDLGAFERQP
ncbi:MAG: right-handed parallel beta-helix repeat-containing protein [Planctomycetes bacterium]|nr:right-handed parallel beta-helix repeat-containing protein [Planctomycetota bacterium]